ncbi:MAG: DUF2202 domain-containing protein [SAR324 cluster bacterium]|nr:DUF2202 domain-containing protein [SAR324 cluster bacterium]
MSDTQQSQKNTLSPQNKVMIGMLVGVIVIIILFGYLKNRETASIAPGSIVQGQNVAFVANSNNTTLTQQEYEDLLFMREEEKMALDVYQFLSQQWQFNIFSSIAQSEQRHTNRVANLLNVYNIPDPSLNKGPGEFLNNNLSELYSQLVVRGQSSILEALKVGALIEEVDIRDLDAAIQATDKQDIIFVYNNIRNGSYHHLRAFVHSIELYENRYQAVILPQERVDSIVQSPLVLTP